VSKEVKKSLPVPSASFTHSTQFDDLGLNLSVSEDIQKGL